MLLGKDYTVEKAFNHFDEDKNGEADYVFKVVSDRF